MEEIRSNNNLTDFPTDLVKKLISAQNEAMLSGDTKKFLKIQSLVPSIYKEVSYVFFDLVKKVLSETKGNDNHRREEIEKKIRQLIPITIKEKFNTIGDSPYLLVINHYLSVAATNSEEKEIAIKAFKEIFYEDFTKDEGSSYFIPQIAFEFYGLQDLIDIDTLNSVMEVKSDISCVNRMLSEIYYMAISDFPLLIVGESGTSKDFMAQALHLISNRRKEEYLEIDCASIPENLFESELFGHERGAFTGAITPKKGRFELADKGIIFLDEIAKMPPPVQSKLLKFVEKKYFYRLGGNKEIKLDVRIIAACQPDDIHVHDGKINIISDLLKRFGNIIEMPPLNDRMRKCSYTVIEASLNRVLQTMRWKTESQIFEPFDLISQEAYDLFKSHDYTNGNYRDLERFLSKSLISAQVNRRSKILPDDLPPEIKEQSKPSFIIDKEMKDTKVNDIKLTDIITYVNEIANKEANKIKAPVLISKVKEIYKNGKTVKEVMMDEGSTLSQYNKFVKDFNEITGQRLPTIKRQNR